jgi:beta-N-acetylhexosaminidase
MLAAWHKGHPEIVIDQLEQTIAHMSLDEKLGQLFLAEYAGTDYNSNNSTMVEQQYAGGILLYEANIQSAAQTRAMIAASQAHAPIPLFVVIDEEGGYVDRLEQIDGFRPSAQMIGATSDPNYARSQGAKAASDMYALGINFDFAPDVDVGLVQGQDLRTRVFGSTPDVVTEMAGAYLQGLQRSGHVIGTLKHFPGLGSVLDDAHLDLPTVKRTLDQLESVELAPYRALIATGQVYAIMPTDLLVPALDPTLPSELSPATIDGVLRQQLGFNGVCITDALYMAGIAKTYSMPQAGVMAIEAGCDMLVGPAHPWEIQPMVDALRSAVQSEQISMQRIDESVRRILKLKVHMGLMQEPVYTRVIPAHSTLP